MKLRNEIIAAFAGGLLVTVAIGAVSRLTDGTVVRWMGGVAAAPAEVEPVNIGYGTDVYRHTTTGAECPEGTYVAGIIVHYGGTCLTKCDQDGGIIQNIELECKPF